MSSPAASSSAPAPPIRRSDRVLVVGMNGSGKSELAAHLFNQIRVRRILIDPKADWRVAGAPRYVLRAESKDHALAELEGIDWTAPIVHVQPGFGAREQLQALYGAIDALPAPLCLLTDEAYMTTTGSWEPTGLRSLQATGRSRGYGHIACTQRPINISVALRTEAQHVMVFRDVAKADLLELLSQMPYVEGFDMDPIATIRELPEFGFVWFDKRGRDVRVCDPLPPALLGRGPITKAPGR